MKSLSKQNLGLMLSSLAVALLSAELAVRLVVRDLVEPRTLFFSEQPWEYDDRGFTRYRGALTLRTAAVYGDHLDYDVWFSTNAQGFVDNHEYARVDDNDDRRGIAIIGDSFTAGYHGGTAWVPSLREVPGLDPDEVRLYNLGVSGTGVPNFINLLVAYREALRLDEALIVAINDDFERPVWRPFQRDGKIVLCPVGVPNATCAGRDTQILLMTDSADLEELRSRATAHLRDRDLVSRLKSRSALAQLARGLRAAPKRRASASVSLRSVRHLLPDTEIKLLHLPEKWEVESGRFLRRQDEASSAGIAYYNGYELCGLTESDFFGRDSHPNASGYEKIRTCALRILAPRQARR